MTSKATKPKPIATKSRKRKKASPKLEDRLCQHDIEDLQASGLFSVTILTNGIRSESDSEKIATLLNHDTPKIQNGGLIFPYADHQGEHNGFARVKPHYPRKNAKGKEIKYEQPTGEPCRAYFPIGSIEAINDGETELVITEGEKKALALDQATYSAIGLSGVYGWKVKDKEELIPDLQQIEWSGRTIYICFDHDEKASTRKDVIKATKRLAELLESEGATVYVIQLPPSADGGKQGVDDFLVADKNREFDTLVKDAIPADELEYEDEDSSSKEDDGKPRFRIFTGPELASLKLELTYLAESILCKKHPCMIVGPIKSMKTSLAIDLSVSLASGGAFLNFFDCKKSNVLLMSGESGEATVRETASRIAGFYEHSLNKLDGWRFSPDLPKFSTKADVDELADVLEETETEVLIVDPAYLCVDPKGRESSVFAVGSQLSRIGDACKELGVTFILLHHTKQNVKPGKAVKLQDASWAGFEQYFRQWITVNRRKDYKPGTGKHELIVASGGSMGHSAAYHVDIEEGTVNNGGSRHWKASVTPDFVIKKEGEKKQKSLVDAAHAKKIETYLHSVPSGDTKSIISEATGIQPSICNRIITHLSDKGIITECKVMKSGRKYTGYKIST